MKKFKNKKKINLFVKFKNIKNIKISKKIKNIKNMNRKEILEKIKLFFKSVLKKCLQYIRTNRLFLTYLILSILGTIIIRFVTINSSFSIKPICTDLALILLFGSFGYFVKPKNQYRYFLIWLIIFTIIEIVNSVYFTFYATFASITELASLSQAETVTNSIFAQLRVIDFIYILQPIIFCYIHKVLKGKSYYKKVSETENGKKMFLFTLFASFCFLVYSFETATNTDFSRLSKQWNRNYVVERFGVIMYQFNDSLQYTKTKLSSLVGYEDNLNLFNEYFSEREKYDDDNKYTGILEGYNIVYVHMESMQNFLMDLEFNGEMVTPNLNKLAKEGLFFSNFYPQISTGTSSDAEYMMLTGLLPSLSGTVFVNYSYNKFVSIATQLQDRGYYTFSMHGNYSSMWKRNIVHPNLGYQELYFRDTFTFDEENDVVGLGVNDKVFFEQAISKLENIEENNDNYFGTVITLSNHSPFDSNENFTLDINDYYEDLNGETLNTCYLCDRDIGKYIVSSNYADQALGDFLTYIKESDYFDNTVFVFYGDHDAKMSYKDMNYLYNYDYLTGELKSEEDETYIEYDTYDHQLNKKTPLIIWTKNKTLSKKLNGEVSTIMGMYDAAPTLYNMLNIDNSYVLGHDIFNIKDDNIVVFPNGNYLTSKVYYNNSTGQYKILNNQDTIYDSDYIQEKLEYTEITLEVGNAIVTYDLFNKRNELE